MCSATLIFILCAGAVIDVFPTEITRPKKTSDFERWLWGSVEDQYPINYQNPIPQTSDFERWLWGSFEDQYPINYENPIPQTNFSFSLSFNFGVTPELKFTATSSNSDYELDLLNVPPKGKRRKNTTKAPFTSRIETKPTDPPTTSISITQTKPTDPSTTSISKTQTKPTDPPTTSISITQTKPTDPPTTSISITQTKPTDPPTTSISVTRTKPTDSSSLSTTEIKPTELSSTITIDIKSTNPLNISPTITDAPSSVTPEIKSTDSPSTPTTENKPNNAPISSTIEPILTQTSSGLVAELRLLNSSDSSSPKEDNEREKETTTEVKDVTEATSVSPETTTADYCDPLPGKPDFSAPGRRLNEAKCMGYVWELQNRIKKDEKDLICKKRLFVNHAVGGRKTEVGEFPHMGALGWKATVGTWVFKCGSSLISSNFVLTAAHCTKASPRDSSIADPVPKIVRLGDKRIIDKENFFTFPTDANISRIIIHPQYKPPMKYNDIALMELEEPVEFTRLIQPACLWNSFSTGEPGHEATLTGWGVIESGSLKNSPELQAATVDVLENAQCDGLLQNSHNRNWKGFQENQLCAGKLAGGVDSCQGDSGGPLQMKMNLSDYETDRQGQMHYVIGIISFGVGCAHKNLPGVYTRVSSFIDWIEDNVWRNGNERVFVPPPESEFLSFSSGSPSFLRG